MTKLIKRLHALADGRELPWKKIAALLEAYGGVILPPRGGGSHYSIYFKGYNPVTIPVHDGKIKRIYVTKLVEILEELEG